MMRYHVIQCVFWIHVALCFGITDSTLFARQAGGDIRIAQQGDSLSTFHGSDLEQARTGHLHGTPDLLQGRIPGLQISKPGADPNGRFYIRSRGLHTLYTDNDPLIVIDGVPDVPLSLVDPEDISSVRVIRDGTAAHWGFRGSGGVIEIDSRQYGTGAARIRFRSYLAAERPTRPYDVLDAREYIRKEIRLNGSYEPPGSRDNNWTDIITRTALSNVNNLSVTGGTESLRYTGSLNWRNVEGIALDTGYDRVNGRMNLLGSLLDDRLNLGLSVSGSTEQADIGFREAFKYAITFSPAAPRRADLDQFGGYYQKIQFDYFNPLAILEQNRYDGDDRWLSGTISATYDFQDGEDGLSSRLVFSETRSDLFRGAFYPADSFFRGYEQEGFARTESDDRTNRYADLKLQWRGDFAGNVALEARAGYSAQNLFHDYTLKEAAGIPGAVSYSVIDEQGVTALGGEVYRVEEDHLLSAYYGTTKLQGPGWFVNLGLRREHSSNLGENHEWGTFPYINAGYDLAGILNLPVAETVQLRAGYGLAGNLPRNSLWSQAVFRQSGFVYRNGEFVPSFSQQQVRNPDLKWESTRMLNAGIDILALENRLQLRFDLFSHSTADVILDASLPQPPFPAPHGYFNIGEMTNKGVELSVKYQVVRQRRLSYSTGLNLSTIRTSYQSLSNAFYSLDGEVRGNPSGGCGCGFPFVRVNEGEPAGQFYGPKYIGIDGEGEWVFDETNGRVESRVIGNGLPSSMVGWSHGLEYKNWGLDLFLRGVFGHDLVPEARLIYENKNLGVYNILESSPENLEEFNRWSSYYVEDGDFLRLENVTLSYRFSLSDASRIRSASLFLGVDNLVTITGYSGPDPSVRVSDPGSFFESSGSLPWSQTTDLMTPGIDRPDTWLSSRNFLLGITLDF
ncbi:MAG: TonB-dependent receptor [Balneolaceae bacterium]|nr:TonB-dependent receptor [Balneolaceae bacterium]